MKAWILRAAVLGLGATLAIVTDCGGRTGLPDGEGHAEIDAGQPDVEGVTPPEDAEPNVPTADCDDAGTTSIYLMTSERELFTFDPLEKKFTSIGTIDCPDRNGAAPFSMGMDRKGTAYVVFSPDGELYQVSTANASCKATSFVADQGGFNTFAMAFSTDQNGPDETLYVAESNFQKVPSKGLGTLDPETFKLNFLTPFSPELGDAVELTGTGDGRLYGLFIDTAMSQSRIAQVDKKSGAVTNVLDLPLGQETNSFAFAFWGGDFYVFHAEWLKPTIVTKVSPSDGSMVDVATLPTHVVGVGVSTCVPEG